MIQSTKGKLISSVLEGCPKKGFPAEIFRAANRKISILNSAHSMDDLRAVPGSRLEKLKGDREGQSSIRINDQWRICFAWTNQGPEDVEIVDYH